MTKTRVFAPLFAFIALGPAVIVSDSEVAELVRVPKTLRPLVDPGDIVIDTSNFVV